MPLFQFRNMSDKHHPIPPIPIPLLARKDKSCRQCGKFLVRNHMSHGSVFKFKFNSFLMDFCPVIKIERTRVQVEFTEGFTV